MQPSAEYNDYDIDESDVSDIFPMIPIGKWEIYKYDDTEEMRFKLKNNTEIRKLFRKYSEYFSNLDEMWKITLFWYFRTYIGKTGSFTINSWSW